MLKEHVRARVPKCLGKESRYLVPLRNPPFFGNLSHLLPSKVAQRFSHKSVRVNICLAVALVKKAVRGNAPRESLVLEAGECLNAPN